MDEDIFPIIVYLTLNYFMNCKICDPPYAATLLEEWSSAGHALPCQLPSSVHAPSSSFLTPRCSSGAPANASPWPRHASPLPTGAEH